LIDPGASTVIPHSLHFKLPTIPFKKLLQHTPAYPGLLKDVLTLSKDQYNIRTHRVIKKVTQITGVVEKLRSKLKQPCRLS